MGSGVAKQFLPIGGEPVLMHTIRRFRAYSPELGIILVLPEEQQEYWKALCHQYSFNEPCLVASGGQTRFHSVLNGLGLIADNDGVVGVHDGVRPFVSTEVIGRCYEAARSHGAAVPVVSVVETLRRLTGQESETVSRSDYRLVQTPQTFRTRLLKEAYEQPYDEAFTDDASVVEHMGHEITLVDGNRENIKLTSPFDLIIAEALLREAHKPEQHGQ